MKTQSLILKSIIAALLSLLLLLAHDIFAQGGSTLRPPVVLGDVPATSEITNDTAPNVLLIFDDTWSMNRPFFPDTLNYNTGGIPRLSLEMSDEYWNQVPPQWDWDTNLLRISTASDFGHSRRYSIIDVDWRDIDGDPPLLTAALNKMTYDPEVTYRPPQIVGGCAKLPKWARDLNYCTGDDDVVSFPDMNRNNTTDWSKANPKGWTKIPASLVRQDGGNVNPSGTGWWSDAPANFFSLMTWPREYLDDKTENGSNYASSPRQAVVAGSYWDSSNNNKELHDRIRKYFLHTNGGIASTNSPGYCGSATNVRIDTDGILPEVKLLLTKYCAEGLKCGVCKAIFPLHYYKTSIKWCKSEQKNWNQGVFVRWQGDHDLRSDQDGYGNGYGSNFNDPEQCVKDSDPQYDPEKYKFAYVYAPHSDNTDSKTYDHDGNETGSNYGHWDNTQYDAYIPVVFDFDDQSKIYVTETEDENGNLKTIKRTFDEELTNYMNWYVYYGFREYRAKTVISRAFASVPPETHIGLVRMSDMTRRANDTPGKFNNPDAGSTDAANLYVAPFTGAHRDKFYRSLFSRMQRESSYGNKTHAALQAAGKYFAGPSSYGMKWEEVAALSNPWSKSPMRYACQRNHVILLTDGVRTPAYDSYFTSNGNIDKTLIDDLPDPNVEIMGKKLKKGDTWPKPINHGGSVSHGSTLADVSLYYWSHNLQPALANGKEKPFQLSALKSDPATWPHLSFSAFGFGAMGLLPSNNQPQTLQNIVDGKRDWPESQIIALHSKTTYDDFWHMAVNGFGKYLSFTDPTEIENSLRSFVENTNVPVAGSQSAPVMPFNDLHEGTPLVYIASYSSEWGGDVKAYQVNAVTGKPETQNWSAASKLKARLTPTDAVKEPWMTGRKIFTFTASDPDADATLTQAIDFNWDNLSEKQRAVLGKNEAQQKKVIAYLRGDTSNEGEEPGQFRVRASALGDIVNAGLIYSGAPERSFDNTLNCGYKEFQEAKKHRKEVIFAAANDGMVHAFDATSGEELWAFLPANLIRAEDKGGIAGLTSRDLTTQDVAIDSDTDVPQEPDQEVSASPVSRYIQHRYYADATPQLMDVQINNVWRTVLAGGLGKGGSSYWALDVTDPDNPVALWEYTDKNMGYTYGRPLLIKTEAGQVSNGCNSEWIAILPSGLNNGSGRGQAKSGDGLAHLYFRNLADGSEWRPQMSGTDNGSKGWPAGLGMIASFIDNDQKDQLVRTIYGGDQRGGLWRFDLDKADASEWSVKPFANHLSDPQNNWQPVSTRPSIVLVSQSAAAADNAQRWIMLGTGRMTSRADAESKITNTFYAFRDGTRLAPDDNPVIDRTKMRNVSASTPTEDSAVNGWYQDLPEGWHFVSDSAAFASISANGGTARALVVYSAIKIPEWVDSASCTPQRIQSRTFFRDVTTGALTYQFDYKGYPAMPQIYYSANGNLSIGVQFDDGLKLVDWQTAGMPPPSAGSPDYQGVLQRYMLRFIDQ